MATLTIRLDEKLKSESYETLEKLGLTPSEYLRQALEYVVEQQKTPFKTAVITEKEDELLALVRERLANPQEGIKVTLDDL